MGKQQMGGKTALIYCRVGSNQGQDGAGFALQEATCIQHALSLGYEIARVTKEVSSGTVLWERPLFSCDWEDMGRQTFAALIAFSPDRLSRDPRQMAMLAKECERARVALLFAVTLLDEAGENLLHQINDVLIRHEQQIIRWRLGK